MSRAPFCTLPDPSGQPRPLPPRHLSWLVWGLGAALYFMSFYQRVAPAVMTDYLMIDFQISAAALGNFSAFYFYSYVAMQVPTGILADHWGPRRLLTAGSLIAALGAMFFAMADSVLLANIGRLLIGGSVAVAWVTLMKLAMHWFEQRMFAFVTGIGLLIGVTGAVSAGAPLRLLVEAAGWRGAMWAMGLLCLMVGICIWIVVRDDPAERGYASYAPEISACTGFSWGHMLRGFGHIFQYRNTVLLPLAQAGMVGTVLAFAGLWGVPYLTTRFGISSWAAAVCTSAIMITWALSGPVAGFVSDRMGRRKPLYVGAAALALAGWSGAFLLPHLPLAAFMVLAMAAGSACGAVIVGFAYAKESVPTPLAGSASGFCNMGSMSGPMILQPVIGWLLDRYWNGASLDGVRVYDLQTYHAAFSPMLAWLVLSLILALLSRETFCRPPSPSRIP